MLLGETGFTKGGDVWVGKSVAAGLWLLLLHTEPLVEITDFSDKSAMIKRCRQLRGMVTSSDFARHSLMLVGGAGSAQALTLLASPLLSRLFTPAEFGVFAMYSSITAVLAVVATGQYEKAIFLPRETKDAYHLTLLALICTIVVSALVLLGVLVFQHPLDVLLGESPMGSMWLFVPITLLLMGVVNTLTVWFSVRKKFRWVSVGNPMKSAVMNGSSIGFGVMAAGGAGLIWGNLLGLLVLAGRFLQAFYGTLRTMPVEPCELKRLALRYRKFPQFTMPQGVLGALSQQLPVMLITGLFSPAVAGFYFLAYRMVSMPLAVVSDALYQVFSQTFSDAKDRRRVFVRKFLFVNAACLPGFVVLWLVAPLLFQIVFGEAWIVSGEYVRIILPLLYARFISNLFTSPVYLFYERQGENLLFSVLINCGTVAALVVGGSTQDIKLGLVLMAASNIALILIKLVRCYGFTVKDRG